MRSGPRGVAGQELGLNPPSRSTNRILGLDSNTCDSSGCFPPVFSSFSSLELANYILSPHLIICTIYVTLLSMQLTVEVF